MAHTEEWRSQRKKLYEDQTSWSYEGKMARDETGEVSKDQFLVSHSVDFVVNAERVSYKFFKLFLLIFKFTCLL